MGGYHSCYVNTTVSCSSYFQDAMTCTYLHGGIDAHEYQPEVQTNCWTNTDRVGVVIVLPIVLSVIALILTAMLINWYRLHRVRKSRQQRGDIDPNYAITHGRYAAGAEYWTFDRDMLPYLMPDCWRVCCIADHVIIRLLMGMTLILVLLAIIFIPLGMETRNHDSDQDVTSDPYLLTAVGWILIPVTIVCCCFTCCVRSRCGRRERERKQQELDEAEQAARPNNGYPPFDAHAIMMVHLNQQQQQQQQQPHAFDQAPPPPVAYRPPNAYPQQVEGVNGLSAASIPDAEVVSQHQVAVDIQPLASSSSSVSTSTSPQPSAIGYVHPSQSPTNYVQLE